MTNELEKQFFSTFGIKSKKGCTAYDKLKEHEADTICNDECLQCLYFDDTYPRITPEILLELICITNTRPVYASNAHGTNVYDLKNYVLKRCIYEVDNIKHQVHTLFEEG